MKKNLVNIFLACVMALFMIQPAMAGDDPENTYSEDEIGAAVEGFFSGTTKGLAQIIEKIFAEKGRPNGYITGNEGSGAIGVGLRYGSGYLHMKAGGRRKVYWQGPSIGFDAGGNASKVFTLCYDLPGFNSIYQRFPGVDGSVYVVGGFSMNYQQRGDIILAPIRTGVGLRAGINVGYVKFTDHKTLNPF